jgi:Subtilase family
MATLVVTGAIALLLERQPGMRPDQVKQLLINSSRTDPGQTDRAGLIDVAKAMAGAANPPNTAQVPTPVSGV